MSSTREVSVRPSDKRGTEEGASRNGSSAGVVRSDEDRGFRRSETWSGCRGGPPAQSLTANHRPNCYCYPGGRDRVRASPRDIPCETDGRFYPPGGILSDWSRGPPTNDRPNQTSIEVRLEIDAANGLMYAVVSDCEEKVFQRISPNIG